MDHEAFLRAFVRHVKDSSPENLHEQFKQMAAQHDFDLVKIVKAKAQSSNGRPNS